jgi:hypothetical protein
LGLQQQTKGKIRPEHKPLVSQAILVRNNRHFLFYAIAVEYINALQRLYIIEDVPAWNPAVRSKTALRSRTKHELSDPSLVVAALGMSLERLLQDLSSWGLCLRPFV